MSSSPILEWVYIEELGSRMARFDAELLRSLHDAGYAVPLFAGVFLYATAHGHTHAQAAWLANQAAARVVSQYGNRLTPEVMSGIKARFAQHLVT